MSQSGPITLQFISEEYRAAIGQVCVQWGLLEVSIESAIWQTSNVQNDIGRVITAQLQMQGKMDLLESLLYQSQPTLAPYFKKVAVYIRGCLLGKRNLVIHGVWLQSPRNKTSASISKFSSRGRLTAQGGQMKLEELSDLSTQIAEVAEWMFVFGGRLPPLKQRPGGLGHKDPDIQNPQNCANLRKQALQPLPSP